MILGAQLYTVRTYTQTVRDFDYTMGEISKMGYTTVQLSGVGKDITPRIAREICDKYQLKIVLTHTDGNRIMTDTKQVIEEHKIMGCKYIGIGSMPEKYRSGEWVGRFYEDYIEAARMIKDAGMLFMYHNHDFEFEKYKGKFIMDELIEMFTPLEMGFTIDTYWLQHAGIDVCDYLMKLKDRIPCVHLKDMEVTKQGVVMAPVLEGTMNFGKILRTLEETSCEYILVEQDTCREHPLVCLKKSFANVSALGYK